MDKAHSRGMRVLLDLTCNHISQHHPIFLEARSDSFNPYRDWFTFFEPGSPEAAGPGGEIGYRTFFGVANLPQLNLDNPEAREWMLDIARYWLREFNVDGYRLDYAIGPSLSFWSQFCEACRKVKPDCYIFGEVVDTPNAQIGFVGRLDGCLDFHLNDALRHTFAFQDWSEEQYQRFLERHQKYFPPNFVTPTFIDNHDMNRFLFLVGGDKDKLRRAAQAQFAAPGPPIVYYGTEVGLNQEINVHDGAGLHVNRVPMIWGNDQDQSLFAFYQELISARRSRQHQSG